MVQSFNCQLDQLFEEWISSYPEDQRYLFCKDGLMLKAGGDADVNELWQNAKRRILFILKDNPDGWGNDTRLWLQNFDNANIKLNRFLQTIADIFYALLNLKPTTSSRNELGYNRVHNSLRKEVIRAFAFSAPFAFIEAKKLAGSKTVTNKEMGAALTKDGDFLKRELDILKPNVIVCCDRYNSQFNFVTKEYFKGKEAQVIEYDYIDEYGHKIIRQRCCLWYYPEDNVVVIKSYHPSYGSLWKTYERVVSVFHAFLKHHPETNF